MSRLKRKSALKRAKSSKEWKVIRLRLIRATVCPYCPNWMVDNSHECNSHLGKRLKDNSCKTWKKYRKKQLRNKPLE